MRLLVSLLALCALVLLSACQSGPGPSSALDLQPSVGGGARVGEVDAVARERVAVARPEVLVVVGGDPERGEVHAGDGERNAAL